MHIRHSNLIEIYNEMSPIRICMPHTFTSRAKRNPIFKYHITKNVCSKPTQ